MRPTTSKLAAGLEATTGKSKRDAAEKPVSRKMEAGSSRPAAYKVGKRGKMKGAARKGRKMRTAPVKVMDGRRLKRRKATPRVFRAYIASCLAQELHLLAERMATKYGAADEHF